MRIGIRLGGCVIGAFFAFLGMAAAHRPPSESRRSPWVDHSLGKSATITYGVYVPTRFGGELTVKASSGKVVELKGPNGPSAERDQRPGDRSRPAGMVYASGSWGPRSPIPSRPRSSRWGRASRSPGISTTGRPRPTAIHEPWAGGNGRVDMDWSMIRGRRPAGRLAGRLHSSRPGHRPGRAQRTAGKPASTRRRGDLVSQPLRRPDLDRPQQGEGRRDHDLPDPLSPAQVRPALQYSGEMLRSRYQPEQGYLAAGRATASGVRSPRSS